MIAQPESSRLNSDGSKGRTFRILWLPTIFCLLLICLEVRWLVGDGFVTSGNRKQVSGEPIATYVDGSHTVLKKTVGTLVWEPPSPQMPLFREDAIATMEGAEAQLVFNDKSELVIEPNSLVILEQAPSGTVLRLVKGSVKRKSSGSVPFFIKLSRDTSAKAVRFDDRAGNSIFRVVYKIEGYDVVVESGSITVDQKTMVDPQTHFKLPAPRLNKPKIEIMDDHSSLWDYLIPRAEARAPKQIQIHFSWEPVDAAKAYRIQVSKQTDFKILLKESEVTAAEFKFSMAAPLEREELYFRVAAIDAQGSVGDYSPLEMVEVNPVVEPKPIIAVTTPTPKPTATPAPAPEMVDATPTFTPAPEVKHESVIRVVIPPAVSKSHLWLGYEVSYDHRNFKNDVNPLEASGGGIVPAALSAEFRYSESEKSRFAIGGTYLIEKASPDLPPPSNTALSTALFRAWVTYGKGMWSVGPYISSSRKFTNSGISYSIESKLLIGAAFALQNDLERAIFSRELWWRAQLALIPVGTVGADALISLRQSLSKNGLFKAVFGTFDGGLRLGSLESSFNAALGFGIWY